MRRREFLGALSGALAALPFAASAQQAERPRRIGVLMGWAESDPATLSLVTGFRETLAQLGWTEEKNLQIELRWGNGDASRIDRYAKELVALGPAAIVGQTTPVVRALAGQTHLIPIVFVQVSDPIGSGFVASLARPGGNITGFTTDNSAQGGKWVELLKEIAPGTTRVAVLFNPKTAAPTKYFMPTVEAAASSLGVQADLSPISKSDEIESVIKAEGVKSGTALIVTPDPFNVANRDIIIALAARYRVPAIYFNRFFAESGGLIVYGSPFAEFYRQAAGYVDRILRGSRPSDLPVQTPTKFELIINLKAAKALGLQVPLRLQQLSDELID